MDDLETRLRNLAAKWIAQSHHPQRRNKPGEKAMLEKHATELLEELHRKPPPLRIVK